MKRKRSYYSYSKYGKGRRLNYTRIGIVAGAITLVLAVILLLNLNRLKLTFKGYSFKQVNTILKLDKKAVKTLVNEEKLDNILDWIETSDKYDYYDEYQKYYGYHRSDKYKVVVSNVDTIFDTYVSALKDNGYSSKQIWQLIKKSNATQVAAVAENNYSYTDIMNYLKVDSFDATKMSAYKDAYSKYNSYSYAVLIVNYPFIDSANSANKTYQVTNTDDVTILVKKGFTLSSKYKPSDLVDLSTGDYNLKTAEDCEKPLMKKEAAKQLVKMFKAAKKDGYDLVVNSAYRSYKQQKEVYEEYHKIYDPVTAASLVSKPGTSEHQTGLGVDLTCQAVLDDKENGIENTRFSYKPDYTWCKENSYKYGFILRFNEDSKSITGIANEPWHFRYVGVKVATMCYENDWTLEEYVLYTGSLPKLKEVE